MYDSDTEFEMGGDRPFIPPPEIVAKYSLRFLDGVECRTTRSFAHGGSSDIFWGTLNLGGRRIPVAIKTMHGAHCKLDKLDEYCGRLVREATHLRNAAQIERHDNIVQFFGISGWNLISASPTPGLVTQYCHYGTVNAYLISGRKTPEIRLKLVRDVAGGLKYLHDKGVIHGDMKPNNVLLVKRDGTAAICDFGQARVMYSPTGLTTKLKATPQYTAPELLEGTDRNTSGEEVERGGRSTTFQADVYAFSMTILEITSGRRPFASNVQGSVISKITKGERPDVGRHSDTLAINGLWNVIGRCWAHEPSHRPSMTNVVQDLARVRVTG